MQSTVAIVQCDNYDESAVRDAIRRGVDLCGGIGAFVQPREKILVKPNLLAADTPEGATTTHPAVFGAVVAMLVEAGAEVSFGDSPGFGSPASVARKTGITAAGVRAGGVPGNFTEQANLPLPDGNPIGLPALPVARAVVDADGIVSVPKLKTHALMRLTGAVKNQLGCVIGFHKARMHMIARDADRFGELLVTVNQACSPRLYVMDAVVAMEGNGPRAGTPRKIGVILVSSDPVALDATAASLIRLNPDYVPTNVTGQRVGHGTARADEITLAGDCIDDFLCADFEVVRHPARHHLLSHFAFMKNLLEPRPVIDHDLCRRCGVCVDACPVPSKAVQFPGGDRTLPPVYDYDACIRCFCCQEMCPHESIRVVTPLLGRLPGVQRAVGHRN